MKIRKLYNFTKLVIVFSILVSVSLSCKKSDTNINPQSLAKIPVLHEGRIKPLDTFARVHLLAFYGKSKLNDITPMDWLLELLFEHDKAYVRPVFKIRNPDTVAAFKLTENKKNVYSFREMSAGFQDVMSAVGKLQRIDKSQRTPSQKEMLNLAQAMMVYYEISRSMSLILPDFVIQTDKLAKTLGLTKAVPTTYMKIYGKQRELQKIASSLTKINSKKLSDYQQDVLMLGKRMQFMDNDARSQILRIIPPQWKDDKDSWFSPWSLVSMGRGSTTSAKYLKIWEDIAISYRAGNAPEFKKQSLLLYDLSKHASKDHVSTANLTTEIIYNKMDFFTLSLVFYILSFLLLMVSWMYKPDQLRTAAYYIMTSGLVLHITGLIFRIYIMGRPPVSTLYESVIFVGFISVLTSFLLERVKKNGIGILMGSLIGAILHFIGFGYSADGDSMGMLVAVLNTNFWLATHVVTITIGYGACFVGGFIGHIYLVRKYLNPEKKAELTEIYNIMLGISLVALFFSMFGTILGGIWADQSWGRFWGWDPKENGALLICLWILFVLHGRLAGYYKGVGFALGMIFLNIIVAVAWFGVNLLNIGLHSYGFTDSIAMNLGLFCLTEILFMLILYSLIYRQEIMQKIKNTKSDQT